MNVDLTTGHRGRSDRISEHIRIGLNDRGTKIVHRSRGVESVIVARSRYHHVTSHIILRAPFPFPVYGQTLPHKRRSINFSIHLELKRSTSFHSSVLRPG